MRQGVNQSLSTGGHHFTAPGQGSAPNTSAVFYPTFYSSGGAAGPSNGYPGPVGPVASHDLWGRFSSFSLEPHAAQHHPASPGHSSHGVQGSGGAAGAAGEGGQPSYGYSPPHPGYAAASAGPWHPGGPASTSMGGAATSPPGGPGQYYGYAAVPCIMVPTGDPIFYTHTFSPPPHTLEHAPPRQQLLTSSAFPAPPPARPRKHRHHSPMGHLQHLQPHLHHQPASIDGSRSVSSFSSGVYATLVDSSSEGSQEASGQAEDAASAGAPAALTTPSAIGTPTTTISPAPTTPHSPSSKSTPSTSKHQHPQQDEPASWGTNWGDLTVGILQQILNKLVDAEIKQLRQVCRHWRGAIDHNLDTLTPSSLMSKLITMRFPNLKLLHLTNCSNVRNRDLQLLSNGGLRLHTLTLGDDANRPWVSNCGLAWIGKVTTLTALNLQDCTQLTNRGLQPLQKLTALSALSLKGCNKLNNAGLDGLRHNTALTSLSLTGCIRVSDKGLLPLTCLPSLLSLQLGGTRVKDEGMEYLARITTLQHLHFSREGITDAGIMQLSTLTNLQTLALRECPQVTGDSLSTLVPQLSNLQSLDLFQSYDFDDAQLSKCLDFLGSVTFLDLRGTVVSEEGIQQLARLQNLQKLCLAPKNEIRVEQHLCVVSHLTQLTSLAINNCKLVSFDLMASLAHLKLLRELDISNNGQTTMRPADVAAAREPVNDGAIRAMTNITSLTSIDLSRRSVHEEQLNVLAEHLPKLRTLFVVGCPVLYETLQALHRRFPELVIHRKPLHDQPPISCSASEHSFA